MDDLGRVGAFIRIAYNGVGAAGPKFTDHQIEIQRLGYDVTKLCDKSALTVAKSKKASSSILTDLQATYEYLLDNLEEMALETLSAVSKLAGDMETAARELHGEFVQEEKKVEVALEKTQKARGAEAQRIKDMQKEREIMEIEKKRQQQLMKEQQQLEQEASARRRDLEQQEDKAIADMDSSGPGKILKKLCNSLTSKVPIIGCELFDTESPEKKVQALKDASIRAYAKEQEIRHQRHDTLSKMTEFACKIKDCETEENMAEIAEGALHQAIGALKELSAVMMQAAVFWKQMQDHCKSLAESEMTNQVERAMKLSEDRRLKVWTSRGFKIKAIEFYAGWVALHGVCKVYVEHIKHTQEDLYNYIRENPTYEQSRQNVKRLAKEFLDDLKRDQKALSDKEFQAQEEIKALESSQ